MNRTPDPVAPVARSAGRKVMWCVALAYALLTLLYAVAPPTEPALAMGAISAVAGALFGALAVLLGRCRERWVYPIILTAGMVAVGHGLGYIHATGDTAQTVVVLIALMGTAMVTQRVMYTVVACCLTIAAWVAVVEIGGLDDHFDHWLVNLVFVALVAPWITVAQERMIRRMLEEQDDARAAQAKVAEQALVLAEQAKALTVARDVALEATRVKSEFLSNVSRELRTPLNGVLGMSELLLDGSLSPDHMALVSGIRDSGKTLAALIDDILDFDKLAAGTLRLQPEPFDVVNVCESAIAMARSAHPHTPLAIAWAAEDTVPRWVHGDPMRLRQVLVHLLTNALKFTDAGAIHLRVTRGETATEARPVALRFQVEDTGIGIARDKLGTVFDSFRQADHSKADRVKGVGLGLALSRRLVDVMGGRLGVESTIGKGSTFWVDVPFARSAYDVTDALSSEPTEPHRQHGRGRVLLVEDNAINRAVVERLLGRLGYDVHVAINGLEALAAVRSRSFDAVIMDCHMPDMDGFDATSRIRADELQTGLHVPIIALTASVLDADRERCFAVGMDEILAKPVQLATLATTLERWTREPARPRLAH